MDLAELLNRPKAPAAKKKPSPAMADARKKRKADDGPDLPCLGVQTA